MRNKVIERRIHRTVHHHRIPHPRHQLQHLHHTEHHIRHQRRPRRHHPIPPPPPHSEVPQSLRITIPKRIPGIPPPHSPNKRLSNRLRRQHIHLRHPQRQHIPRILPPLHTRPSPKLTKPKTRQRILHTRPHTPHSKRATTISRAPQPAHPQPTPPSRHAITRSRDNLCHAHPTPGLPLNSLALWDADANHRRPSLISRKLPAAAIDAYSTWLSRPSRQSQPRYYTLTVASPTERAIPSRPHSRTTQLSHQQEPAARAVQSQPQAHSSTPAHHTAAGSSRSLKPGPKAPSPFAQSRTDNRRRPAPATAPRQRTASPRPDGYRPSAPSHCRGQPAITSEIAPRPTHRRAPATVAIQPQQRASSPPPRLRGLAMACSPAASP